MEELFKKQLTEGEKLLYIGRPKTARLMDKTNKTAFIVKVSIALFLAVALSVGYAVYCSKAGSSPKTGLYVFMVLVVVVSAYSGYSDVKSVNEKLGYALSDRRLLVLVGDSVKSVDYEKIPCVKAAKDDDGNESFLFGKSAAKLKPSAWRKMAVVAHLTDMESGLCDEFVMLSPENSDKVKAVLKQYLTVM